MNKDSILTITLILFNIYYYISTLEEYSIIYLK